MLTNGSTIPKPYADLIEQKYTCSFNCKHKMLPPLFCYCALQQQSALYCFVCCLPFQNALNCITSKCFIYLLFNRVLIMFRTHMHPYTWEGPYPGFYMHFSVLISKQTSRYFQCAAKAMGASCKPVEIGFCHACPYYLLP